VIDKILSEIKQKHPEVDLEDLHQKIAPIRTQGFCVKNGSEDGTHVGCVVAPIFEASGAVNACLGISTPEYRFPEDPEAFVALVVLGAAEISRLLGYNEKRK
ncbi:MAG TPA: IclR family transcriptional regulator C-terminal domain-containing protein, partial [Clostridia bacterium]|nr:IclR family transcriptional regulator C-terminal domain-containing protein [Clostridia bacterium]